MERVLCSKSMPFTHQSINSKGGVLFEIRRSEQTHWFLGLKTAESFVIQKASALEECMFQMRQYEREIKKKLQKIEVIEGFVNLNFEQELELEGLRDEVAQAQRRVWENSIAVRDAQMELETAKAEQGRIWNNAIVMHPDLESLSYEEAQSRFAIEAQSEVMARNVAPLLWAAAHRVPAEVGVALFHLPEGLGVGQRDYVLRRALEIRSTANERLARESAIDYLAQIPDDLRDQVLMQAVQIVGELNGAQ